MGRAYRHHNSGSTTDSVLQYTNASSTEGSEPRTANERVVDSLREGFNPLTVELTWEIEPAPVYSPHLRVAEAAE